jgi:hypothetical protein
VPDVPLVGRAHELADLRQWLTRALGSDDADDVDRLLVVSGPGGIGKTRFVTELLRSTADVPVGRARAGIAGQAACRTGGSLSGCSSPRRPPARTSRTSWRSSAW